MIDGPLVILDLDAGTIETKCGAEAERVVAKSSALIKDPTREPHCFEDDQRSIARLDEPGLATCHEYLASKGTSEKLLVKVRFGEVTTLVAA